MARTKVVVGLGLELISECLRNISHQPAQMQNIDIPPERLAEPQEYLSPYHI